MLTYYAFFVFLFFSPIFCMQYHDLIKPNVNAEKIENWKQKALGFLGKHFYAKQDPSEFLKNLCCEPLLPLHEELVPEHLLSTDVARKLQSQQLDELPSLLEKVINERYKGYRFPPGWRSYRIKTDTTSETYLYKRCACAIIIVSGHICPTNNALLFTAVESYQDFIMAKFLLERGALPTASSKGENTSLFIRNKYLLKLFHAYNWPMPSLAISNCCIADKDVSSKFLQWCIAQGIDMTHIDICSFIYKERFRNLITLEISEFTDKLAKCQMLINAGVRINKEQDYCNVMDYLKECAQSKENCHEKQSILHQIIELLKSTHTQIK